MCNPFLLEEILITISSYTVFNCYFLESNVVTSHVIDVHCRTIGRRSIAQLVMIERPIRDSIVIGKDRFIMHVMYM